MILPGPQQGKETYVSYGLISRHAYPELSLKAPSTHTQYECIKSGLLTSLPKQLIFSMSEGEGSSSLNQWLISSPRNQITWIFALSMD